ncbi:hypothetical protein J3Q64DRAFT_1695461 [Phycomyces blakesleeanus]|uniref:Uncharacterized protein n=2 Tax=Phycomyces blakesleeanus TaxID=4837 RepID=A0A162XV47_PHYB8|nr:hypothetical protein PHYBLDRAFT_165141 [Phycomyces blakesleeanus NRRL 1555(-)]OAD76615.1 hypothetical protein PHYBLDRAFT_165141 [Phycomyces blakesleeanus NRRL 1555(-)]|eukprot:XP_018294655.1 hypothetical protein PHYBLDRAFT_165141 [Phycomyces blakesleeanus NRRL 1555(-)]
MLRWTVLNQSDAVESRNEAELKVEKLVRTYNRALLLHQTKQHDEAKQLYQEILTNDMKSLESLKDEFQTETSRELLRNNLPYLTYKNYAEILKEEYNVSNPKESSIGKKAIKLYLKALGTDPTDPTVWCKVGDLSLQLDCKKVALKAYQRGLSATLGFPKTIEFSVIDDVKPFVFDNTNKVFLEKIQFSFISPNMWRCLDGICTVWDSLGAAFKIGNIFECTFYIDSILPKYPHWPVGKKLRKEIDKERDMDIFINQGDNYGDDSEDEVTMY